MIDNEKISELSFEDIMKMKSELRDRQVESVYSSTDEELESAANLVKDIWKKSSDKLKRPQRFCKLKK